MRHWVWMVVWVPLVACGSTAPNKDQPTEDSVADVTEGAADSLPDALDVVGPPDAGSDVALDAVDGVGEDVEGLPDAFADAEDHDSVDVVEPRDQVVEVWVDSDDGDASEVAQTFDTLADSVDDANDGDPADIGEMPDIAVDVPDVVVEVDATEVEETPDSGPDVVAPTGDFGQLCLPDAKCLGSWVCYTFGDGIPRCTQACTAGDQCPAGSAGSVCTSKGYCKP
jgi:hypothetical protein